MANQAEFLGNLRRALGRGPAEPGRPDGVSPPDPDAGEVEGRVESIMRRAREDADGLTDLLEASAARAGWKVARVPSAEDAAVYVVDLVRGLEARSLVRSAQPIVDRLGLEAALADVGARVTVASADDGDGRAAMRREAVDADLGVTGVDYAIAETGSCVLMPRRGVSRLVSLLPPVHVAVVERGQVLPGLDELFALCRADFLRGAAGSYVTLISGPSRSADIEYTLVTGVHGPGEVHMLLVG